MKLQELSIIQQNKKATQTEIWVATLKIKL